MMKLNRRDALKLLASAGATAAVGCKGLDATAAPVDPVLAVSPLGSRWPILDPFLFCVHHDDRYPQANDRFGPNVSLAGRNIGSDFAGIDGWNMYHGDVVPGFPQHPHRGFETITIVRRGLLDHSDSLGAAARYGRGDVQWLTAGGGILHAEMFPLIDRAAPNPVELFQIWLNLPAANKMVAPHFSMLWSTSIPRRVVRDAGGGTTELTIIAGEFDGVRAPPPPPSSWASSPQGKVTIFTLAMSPGARFTLPAAPGTRRMLYVFNGAGLGIAGRSISARQGVELRSEVAVELECPAGSNGSTECLLLQAAPIGEPVVYHGPFVMTSKEEIRQAIADYRRTSFGGWPWARADPVHGEAERFARHADGRTERPA